MRFDPKELPCAEGQLLRYRRERSDERDDSGVMSVLKGRLTKLHCTIWGKLSFDRATRAKSPG
jgi:hypothetical protein